MLPRSFLSFGLALGLCSGCALHTPPDAQPPRSMSLPPDYAWPPKTIAADGSGMPEQQAKSNLAPAFGTPLSGPSQVRAIPALAAPASPSGCLSELDQASVAYAPVSAKRGVVNPVQVHGELGGIRYVATAGLPLIVDCRFAVTLLRVAPLLRELGVSAIHYSGAYVYRMSSKGRLSLHAYGLAIDIHEMTIHGEQLSVKRAFSKGLGDSCAPNFPPLNQVACQLERTGAFREFLTPDYDANHHDHLHLAIAPAIGASSFNTRAGQRALLASIQPEARQKPPGCQER